MAERMLADTNVLIRFLTGEPPALAQRARALVASADAGDVDLVVLPLIVAETVYTLESYYKMNAPIIVAKLTAFLQSRGVVAEDENLVLEALKRHGSKNIHFADAYLAACAVERSMPVVSFDRDFSKFDDIRWIEPKGR
ncbi:MAG: PIN domain-containing protein [Candidatus Omnitrophota bacterium]